MAFNTEKFFSAAVAALQGSNVSRVESAEPHENRDGSASLWLHVKTSRAPSWGDECDGTTPPSEDAIKAMETLAAEQGLGAPRFEEVEKGWGIFTFPLS